MKFKTHDKHKIRANLDLTPLIDVVFQLLIFFMLAATFVTQNKINIDMPEAEGTSEFEQKEYTLTLTNEPGGPEQEGKIYLNQSAIDSYEQLLNTLTAAKNSNPKLSVLIRSDKNIAWGRVAHVLGLVNKAEISPQIGVVPPSKRK